MIKPKVRNLRILVTGSRSYNNSSAILGVLANTAAEIWFAEAKAEFGAEAMKDVDMVEAVRLSFATITAVHGDCPTGADSVVRKSIARGEAAQAATGEHFMWRQERHPADWKTLGRRAGPMRNKKMVELGADVCVAFISKDSKGAAGCANMAERAGIRTIRIEV
jgi:hypothetical protein